MFLCNNTSSQQPLKIDDHFIFKARDHTLTSANQNRAAIPTTTKISDESGTSILDNARN